MSIGWQGAETKTQSFGGLDRPDTLRFEILG